ncbi:TniQ family protein [Streptomyces sp. NPDC005077]|uniref:TniQ family protein n=1 Tax=Streptomyces sp. NPDC005077 TaxID=3154292 RepID=UPI0033ACA2AD
MCKRRSEGNIIDKDTPHGGITSMPGATRHDAPRARTMPPARGGLQRSAVWLAPASHETTLSYLTRLASAHHYNLLNLLKVLGIQVQYKAQLNNYGEIYLSPGARQTVATLSGIHDHQLGQALPAWVHELRGRKWSADYSAIASRVPFRLTVTGCPRCLATRTGRSDLPVYLSSQQLLCRKHQLWALGAHRADGVLLPYTHADVSALPEVAAAGRLLQRLQRRTSAIRLARAFDRAYSAVALWWLHHRRSDTVWKRRARAIAPDGNDELWSVLARDAILYPEQVELTRLLINHGFGAPWTLDIETTRRAQQHFHSALLASVNRPWLTARTNTRIYIRDNGDRRYRCSHSLHRRVPRALEPQDLETFGYQNTGKKPPHSAIWSVYSHRHAPCKSDLSPWMV